MRPTEKMVQEGFICERLRVVVEKEMVMSCLSQPLSVAVLGLQNRYGYQALRYAGELGAIYVWWMPFLGSQSHAV